MKTLISLLALIISAIYVNAQVIPNFNFEDWTSGNPSEPVSWKGKDSHHTGFFCITRSNDKVFGNYSVRIENKIANNDTSKGSMQTLRPNGEEGFGPAFSLSYRANSLTGYYKYIPENGDSFQVIVFITKHNYNNTQGWGELFAWGERCFGAAAVFTPFTTTNFWYDIPVSIPDSGFISLSAFKNVDPISGSNLHVRGNSILYVDALNFDYLLTNVDKNQILSDYSFINNSKNETLDIIFSTLNSEYTVISIYDLNAKLIQKLYDGNLINGNHKMSFNISNLSSGSYIFLISTKNGYKSEKFIKVNR